MKQKDEELKGDASREVSIIDVFEWGVLVWISVVSFFGLNLHLYGNILAQYGMYLALVFEALPRYLSISKTLKRRKNIIKEKGEEKTKA